MSCYRLFFRDPADGRFLDSEVLGDCADDRSALLQLIDARGDRAIELWERARLIAVLNAEPSAG